MRDCKNCVNCDSVRGVCCTCRRSYEEEKDGVKYHVQSGKDTSRNHAKVSKHYTETPYNRDQFFVL